MTQNGILDNNVSDTSKNHLENANGLEFRMDDIYIWHVLPLQNQSKRFDFQGSDSYVQMVFSLDTLKDHLKNKENESIYDLLPGQNDLLFIPKACQDFSTVQISEDRELFGVNISTDLFLKVLPQKSPISDRMSNIVLNEQSVIIKSKNRSITLAMRHVIEQIMRCMRDDHYRCLYYQAKVMELLSLQLAQIESSVRDNPKLKEDELKRVYQVKSILEQNPEQNHTLLGLAHAVGTNDATLKKHFKLIFGTTVFGYLNSHRMEMARKILLEQDCKVSVISSQFGYKHATHFSSAFKKYFGYSPTKLKT